MKLRNWFIVFICKIFLFCNTAFAFNENSGFPATFGHSYPIKGISLANIDGTGNPEIVVILGEGVGILSSEGKIWPGFPKGLRDASSKVSLFFEHAPTVCDLDGDTKQEIILAGSSHMVYAINSLGAEVSGFPVQLNGAPRGDISCLPIKGTKRHDIILTTDKGELVLIAGQGNSAQIIASIGRGAESGVAIADLDGDGIFELITVGGDSRLYVFDTTGKKRNGFPYKMDYRSSGIPTIADIDDDGKPDILIASQDFKIHAINSDGQSLKGFPISTNYRLYAGISVADLNNDQMLELAVGSGDKSIYALSFEGKALPGFPVKLEERIDRDLAIGDVNKDGLQEIVVITETGSPLLLSSHGKKIPYDFPDQIVTAPILGDLDNDGNAELLVATKDTNIHVLKFENKKKAEQAILSWPMPGHDSMHSGKYGPNWDRFKNLSITKTKPKTTDPVRVKYQFTNLDWEAEGNTQIRWYKNGTLIPELNNKQEVPPQFTEKHQKWLYSIQGAQNFKNYGEKAYLSRIERSKEFEIINTLPTAPTIRLNPDIPKTNSTLDLKILKESQDPDGDKIAYRIIWLKNGTPIKINNKETRILPELTKKNENWSVLVIPFDGEEEGVSTSAKVQIQNTPPLAPEISIDPTPMRIEDKLSIKILKPSFDEDQDKIFYTYQYWINDVPLLMTDAESQIPPKVFRKHQKIKIEVTAHDDQEPGEKTHKIFEILNTAPIPPQIVIWPNKPKTSDNLVFSIDTPSKDVDGDKINYRHQWFVDGKPTNFPTVIPSSETKKGQKWKLEITPFDNEMDGPSVIAETQIGNTPPTPPTLSLNKYIFTTDEVITPKIETNAHDEDGDLIKLKYHWYKNNKINSFPDTQNTLNPKETSKKDNWKVEVIPFDGEADGRPATLLFQIQNSPPSAPEIALTPLHPTVKDTITTKITKQAFDKDGDSLTYHYRWFKDGKLISDWPLTKSTLNPNEARKGQRLRVEVRAFDGENEGDIGFSDIWIINHAPEPPSIEISPASPKITDDLICERKTSGNDPDKDTLTYRTRWFVNEKSVSLSQDNKQLSHLLLRKHQTWQCEVEAFDGELISKSIRSQIVAIQNTMPTAPKVSIAPLQPATTDDLVCQIEKNSYDVDLDLIRYRFSWNKDGVLWKSQKESNKIPAINTQRGQTWECVVTPYDDESDGPSAKSQTLIQNSVPSMPSIRILPDKPKLDDTLTCEISEFSKDADGDEIQYSFIWKKNWVKQSFAETSTTVPGRLVKTKDIWQCQVTPRDALASGETRISDSVVIQEGN